MRFTPTSVDGAFVIDLEQRDDDRGFFARTFCTEEFAAHGLPTEFPQANLSHTDRRGTLRGMHYEADPTQECKVVRCAVGAVHDVIIDLRPGSPTAHAWFAETLSRENGTALFVPAGCAHGFLTLTDDVDVTYLMGDSFRPDAGRGVRWNDPAFGVQWPFEPLHMSVRDRTYPDFVKPGAARDAREP